MHKLSKILVIGLTGASLAMGLAHAQTEPGGCPHCKFDKAKFAQFMQKRQAELHQKLQLSAEQEPAWKTFTESMTPPSGARPNPEEFAKLTAPERVERMQAHMQQRQERMTQHAAAVKTFYAVLTPEQKKVFDANFMQPPSPRGRHRGKA